MPEIPGVFGRLSGQTWPLKPLSREGGVRVAGGSASVHAGVFDPGGEVFAHTLPPETGKSLFEIGEIPIRTGGGGLLIEALTWISRLLIEA